MKKKLIEILFKEKKFIRNRFRKDWFKKNVCDLYNKINKSISDDYSFNEKIYILFYDIKPPKCKICNKKVDLWSFNKGFKTYCSVQCLGKDENLKKIKKQTYVKRYGVDNPNKSEIIKQKKEKTCLKRYGVSSPLKSKSILQKIKETNIKRYGVENPFQNKKVQQNIKQTRLKKYGDENYSNREKAKKTRLKKYGVENIREIIGVNDKIKQTNLKKYGVKHPMQSSFVKQKGRETNLKKYIKHVSEILKIQKNDVEILKNGDMKIMQYCEKHNFFEISKQNLYNRLKYGINNICTKCNPISETYRIKENEFFTYIKSFGFGKIMFNTRKILPSGQELDIYIPDHNLAIEFNGLYWHSNLFKDKNYHLNKTIECEEKGIQLIHIFEDEWIYKQHMVKSIIKNKLGLTQNKIYARKCIIKEVTDNELVREFLNNNHIQGYIGSKIKLGLFYNDELVSLMCFRKQNNNYKLNRFCDKLNTDIIGGASKLFKYFINNYKPEEVISYEDRRWGNGELCKQLAMECIEEGKPNYWYFTKNNLERKHRFQFRKDILIKEGYDPNKSEKDIMLERRYYWIYDCGNHKYYWSSKK